MLQPLGVLLDFDTHERVLRIAQEVYQRVGYLRSVQELKDEATATHTELQDGRPVVVVGIIGAPLDVQTDDEFMEAVAVVMLDVAYPGIHPTD